MDQKKLIRKQALLYLEGKSLRQIGKETGQSHVTVRKNLVVGLQDIDPELYEKIIDRIEENKPQTVDDKNVVERILLAYSLLVEKNKTIGEIAAELGSTEFTIYRDLTRRLPKIHENSPLLVTEEMLAAVKIVLGEHSMENSPFYQQGQKKENENGHVDLNKIFSSNVAQMVFLKDVILTFGINLNTLAMLLGVEKEKLKNDIIDANQNWYYLLNYAFVSEEINQDIARGKFIGYYIQLVKAVERNDKETISQLLRAVNDKDCIEIQKKSKSGQKLSLDDCAKILNFQLKYRLRNVDIISIFDISQSFYISRVKILIESDEELAIRVKRLEDSFGPRGGR